MQQLDGNTAINLVLAGVPVTFTAQGAFAVTLGRRIEPDAIVAHNAAIGVCVLEGRAWSSREHRVLHVAAPPVAATPLWFRRER